MRNNPTERPRLLRAPEAARVLGICDRTLRRWILAGAIPQPIVIRGHRYYSSDMIESILTPKTAA